MGTLCSCAGARKITKGTATKMAASVEELDGDAAVQVVVSELAEIIITLKFADFCNDKFTATNNRCFCDVGETDT